MVSLYLGFFATICYGIAGLSVFFWAMGAAEVFIAPAIEGVGVETCACFYQIPEITALVGLSTPFAVFAGFMARVQMQGLAALFGDYLAFQTYYAPHYLGRQSLWWLSMLVQLVVALSASSFMIAFKELCTSLYLR